jgi:hemerythrin-like domain-containing protein
VKRHPSLQPLSDDHHGALVLARQVRRAAERARDPQQLDETWQDVRRRFERDLEPHFRAEEEWLFPQLEAAGERAGIARARADHARLRELARSEAGRALAAEFAAVLHDHVRFEERELFPRAQRLLSAAALEAAGRAALAARGA